MVRLQDGETGYWIHVGETGYMYADRIGWACIMHGIMHGARRRRAAAAAPGALSSI